MVEHRLAKARVASSNLVFRSSEIYTLASAGVLYLWLIWGKFFSETAGRIAGNNMLGGT